MPTSINDYTSFGILTPTASFENAQLEARAYPLLNDAGLQIGLVTYEFGKPVVIHDIIEGQTYQNLAVALRNLGKIKDIEEFKTISAQDLRVRSGQSSLRDTDVVGNILYLQAYSTKSLYFQWNSPAQQPIETTTLSSGHYAITKTLISSEQEIALRVGAQNYDAYMAQKGAVKLAKSGYRWLVPKAPMRGETLPDFFQRVAAPLGVTWPEFLEGNRLRMRMQFPKDLFVSGSHHTVYERGLAEDSFLPDSWETSEHRDGVFVTLQQASSYVPYDHAHDFWYVPSRQQPPSGNAYERALLERDETFARRFPNGVIERSSQDTQELRQQAVRERYDEGLDGLGLYGSLVRFFEPADISAKVGHALSPGALLTMFGLGRQAGAARGGAPVQIYRSTTLNQPVVVKAGQNFFGRTLSSDVTVPAGTIITTTPTGSEATVVYQGQSHTIQGFSVFQGRFHQSFDVSIKEPTSPLGAGGGLNFRTAINVPLPSGAQVTYRDPASGQSRTIVVYDIVSSDGSSATGGSASSSAGSNPPATFTGQQPLQRLPEGRQRTGEQPVTRSTPAYGTNVAVPPSWTPARPKMPADKLKDLREAWYSVSHYLESVPGAQGQEVQALQRGDAMEASPQNYQPLHDHEAFNFFSGVSFPDLASQRRRSNVHR